MEKAIIISTDDLENLIQSLIKKILAEQTQKSSFADIEFLNINQASEYLNMAKQTIYALTSKRNIPFIKRGKKLLFRKSELETWLLEGRKKTVKEIEAEN